MKKIIVLFAVLFSALCFTSCQVKEETRISYEISAAHLSLSGLDDLARWALIETAYSNEISKLGFTRESATYFNTVGFPDECDDLVVSACKVAEASLSDVTLNGGATIEVTAIYWNNASEKVVYSHQFGEE